MKKCHVKFVFSYLRPYSLVWGIGILFAITSILIKIKYNWIMKDLIDEALIKRNLNLLIKLSITFPLLVILSVLFNYLKEYAFSFISQKLIAKMRADIYTHLMHLPYKFFLKTNHGDIINCIINDSENVQRAFTDYIISLISSVFTILLVLFWLFYIDYRLAFIVLIIIPIFTISSLCLWKKTEFWGSAIRQKTSEMTSFIQQALQSIELIKLIRNKTLLTKKYTNLCTEWSKSNLKLVMSRVSMNSLWESILTPYQAIIFLTGGISYIRLGYPSIGTMIAFIDYLNLLIPAMLTLINEIPVVASGSVSVRKIYDYLQEKPELSGDLCINKNETLNVDFKNVYFKHPNTKFSIENLSFSVDEKKFVTFIGTTGSGKSTIAKLIVRLFEPDSGSIYINGQNIKNYNLDNLRDVIGLVQQDTYLLNGTIKDNLLLDNPDLSDYEIDNALHLVELDTLLDRLPLKLNTVIEERGTNLSGGEKQRLSIARVILKRPKLIILDEATSALDIATEKQILDNLKTIFEQVTCIAIDHKLITLENTDKIIVVSDGSIIEEGTLNELINIDSYLKKILEIKTCKQSSASIDNSAVNIT